MPMSAPKPCTQCGKLVRDGSARCDAHKVRAGTFSDRRRGTRHERGYGNAWDKLRKVALARDGGLCVPCQAAGRVTLGNIVDHIIPKAEGGTDDMDNLQTICKPCHDGKTALESARGGRVSILPHWLPKPLVPVHVVCGPPGSGKTTHVRAHAQPGDLVLDLDVIAAGITGGMLHSASREETLAALWLRNKQLAALARVNCPYPCAWLIVTAGAPEERQFWADKTGRPVHVMPTPKEECIRRIQADDARPATVKARQIEAVRRWM